MARTSRCPKCDGTSFEMAEAKITGAAYRHYFIQCSTCGSVVGVTEFFNISNLIHQLAKKLRITL